MEWSALQKFTEVRLQIDESYAEYRLAVQSCTNAVNQYISPQSIFVKNRIISGSPGCGKSFLMKYIMLYAMAKGLKVGVTSMLARRAVHLGGLHIHKLFCLVEKSNSLIHHTAEYSTYIDKKENFAIITDDTSLIY